MNNTDQKLKYAKVKLFSYYDRRRITPTVTVFNNGKIIGVIPQKRNITVEVPVNSDLIFKTNDGRIVSCNVARKGNIAVSVDRNGQLNATTVVYNGYGIIIFIIGIVWGILNSLN